MNANRYKITIINNFFHIRGGADVFAGELFSVLKEKGHFVSFFATDKKPYLYSDYIYTNFFAEYIDHFGFSLKKFINYLLRPANIISYFYNFEAKRKFELFIKEVKPEIVLLQDFIYYLTPSVLDICQKYNIKVIMTLNNPWIICPASSLMKTKNKYCKDKNCINGNYLHCVVKLCKYNNIFASAAVALNLFLCRKVFKIDEKINKYISPSLALKDLAVKSGINSEKIKVIPYFTPLLADINFSIADEGYFLYAGRFVKEKGLYTLLNAIKNLPEINFILAGEGSEELQLKKTVEKMKLSNVRFEGFKDRKELIDLYSKCRAVILPSEWFETFGITIIEAFIAGKPVIGSRIGAISEVIDDNENGLLFSPYSSEELIVCIKKLAESSELSKILGDNGRLKVEKYYSPNVYYQKLLSLIDET